MAWGSLTTVSTPVTSTETFLPVAGVQVASADSVVHWSAQAIYPSGNTGVMTANLYASTGGLNSGTTDWGGPVLVFSFTSISGTTQMDISSNGYWAYRWGLVMSSNSNSGLTLGYRID